MAYEGFCEEDFTCPVCFDYFVNPVVLPCSHSICSDCIQTFWQSKGSNECPICRETSMTDDPPLNLALRNLCETFQQESIKQKSSAEDEAVCSVHREKLKLFCLDDQQPVCLVCRDSRKHADHKFCPLEEAVNNNKEKLRDSLKHLQEKLGSFENFKLTLDQTAELIKNETQNTEEKINKEFEELQEILCNEKNARMTALREEEQQKCQMIMEKTETTSKRIVSLTWKIRDIEEQMKAEDDSFLKNFKTTLQRAKRCPPDPGNVSELLIDGPKYLSDLKITVLQKIESSNGGPSVRGGPSFRGGPSRGTRRGNNARGWHHQRGRQNHRGGPQIQGATDFQGDSYSFGGQYGSREGQNYRGGQNHRGGPQIQGATDFQGDSYSFGGPYNSRGRQHYRGAQSSRGGPEILGNSNSFGGSNMSSGGYNHRGGQTPRGGQQFQGKPEFQKEF